MCSVRRHSNNIAMECEVRVMMIGLRIENRESSAQVCTVTRRDLIDVVLCVLVRKIASRREGAGVASRFLCSGFHQQQKNEGAHA